MRTMVILACSQTGYGGVVHCWVSLPLVAALVDGEKYLLPKNIPRLEGTELRRYRHRGPTLRSLVKLALACDSAEQMGQRLPRLSNEQHRQEMVRHGRATCPSEVGLLCCGDFTGPS